MAMAGINVSKIESDRYVVDMTIGSDSIPCVCSCQKARCAYLACRTRARSLSQGAGDRSGFAETLTDV